MTTPRKKGHRKLRIIEDADGNQHRTLTTYYKFKKRYPDYHYNRSARLFVFIEPQFLPEEEQPTTFKTAGTKEFVYNVKMIYASQRDKGHNVIVELTLHYFASRVPLDDEIKNYVLSHLDEIDDNFVLNVPWSDIVIGLVSINERSGYSYIETTEYDHAL